METKSEQNNVGGMNRKRALIFGVILIVALIVVVAGIYLVMNGGGGTANTSTDVNSAISGASSLQFTVSATNSSGGSLGTYTYYAKNIGTSNLMMRIEYGSSELKYVYIVNGALQKTWVETNEV
jgi:fructose-1,6-bisphosphatase/inositol monophosphatase family enzyme